MRNGVLLPLSLVAQAEARIPRDQQGLCYLCGREFYTYRGLRTIPPDPHLIYRPASGPVSGVIVQVVTCGDPDCERKEALRQDAIFNMLIVPERDRYFAERAARLAKHPMD